MRFTKLSGAFLLALAASASWLTTAGAVTLFDSSNILTGTGNGANGANTSSIASTSTTYGYSENSVGTSTISLAEDFTLSSGSTVNLITFDAYSTSTYPANPTSPFTGATVNIWNAQPGTAGAVILFTSSTLATTAWTGIYRVTSTTLTNSQRPVFTLSVSFNNVALAAGNYWASWSVTSLVSPGVATSVFTPPLMNTDGTQPTGNAIQSTTGGASWIALTDASTGVTNRLPLTVAGNVPEPGPMVWLSLATVGTVLVVRRRRTVA